jgi:hypothetical protein
MAKMHLKQAKTVSRIIRLYGMNGKAITKSMWTDVMDFTGFWINKLG